MDGAKVKTRIDELMAQRDALLGQLQQNSTQRQQLEAAYQQTAGAIAVLHEYAPVDNATDNGQAVKKKEELIEEGV